MSTSQIRALEEYVQLFDRNAVVHVIRSAVELGVISCLSSGQKTCDQMAQELDLDPSALELLLTVLSRTELVEKYRDDYALSPVARLIPSQFMDFGNLHWQYLSDFVRTGSRPSSDSTVPISEQDFLIQDRATQWMQTPAALDAAEILDFGKSRKAFSVLEIGCGSAVFGVSLIHRDPTSRLVLLDDAHGIKAAEQTVSSVGVGAQTEFANADYLVDDWPTDLDRKFDLVVVAAILHRHDASECNVLFQKLAQATHTDGEVAIVDVFPGQANGDERRAIFDLELSLRTRKGRLHSPAEIKAMLESNGFGKVQYAHLPAAPYTWGLTLATRT